MYKLLLCSRYLRTRYIALASIISVTLGVATMIVVNSVMAGFSGEMRDRLKGILSDLVLEAHNLDGEKNPEAQMALIREVAGEYIAGMTSTVEIYGMLSFQYAGQWMTRPVTLVGIDPRTKADVGPMVDYLQSYHTRTDDETGKTLPAERDKNSPPTWEMTPSATAYRTEWARRQKWFLEQLRDEQKRHGGLSPLESSEAAEPLVDGPAEATAGGDAFTGDPFANTGLGVDLVAEQPDLARPLSGRLYIGAGLISFPYEDPETGAARTEYMVQPGDDVRITTVTSGRPPKEAHLTGTIVDVFKSGMSEYDSSLVFCNLQYLQKIRAMIHPEPGTPVIVGTQVQAITPGEGTGFYGTVTAIDAKLGSATIRPDASEPVSGDVTVPLASVSAISRSVTSIQIKLKDYKDAPEVVERLKAVFPASRYSIRTWEQKQGPLLEAVEVEAAILNVLLFLIIAVAGFGILAIFFMIVVEKTRDIGILKALGASSRGVMSIFLGYGLSLGLVGSGVGVIAGLLFVYYINEIEAGIGWLTGREVFDEKIYYFKEIPTQVNAGMVIWVALGAIAIATLASVLPARRAARLHPVRALRYE
jgi:lipoprotein-releasing system permease protein